MLGLSAKIVRAISIELSAEIVGPSIETVSTGLPDKRVEPLAKIVILLA